MSAIPKELDDYKIISEVGAGGLGQVFKAIDQKSGRTVAVKVLHNRYQSSRKFLGIFHRELLIVSRLKHKHIVEFLDANFEPPICYIVTEFVDGWSLHALLKRFGRLPPLVALCIAIDMLQGIDYLHLHDTIHSDLSSPNVMIDRSGRVLVMDFGLACQDQSEDYKNYMIGTPGYYSPEHVTDTSIVIESDLYCVALLIYQMVTGEKAVVASKDRREILRKMKVIDFKKIKCSDRKLQAFIQKLLKVALRVNPSRRYHSAESMVYDIYNILRRYNIRYARFAIHQFLMDNQLTKPLIKKVKQDIYLGYQAPEPSSSGSSSAPS